jgi:hypothetical protein
VDYQWYEGASGQTGALIPGATGASLDTGALVATRAYWVRVSNGAGSVHSITALVTVNALHLAILQQPQSQVVAPGSTATLSVIAQGSGVIAHQWYAGLPGDVSNPVPGATAASFTTPALAQSSTYWVRVTDASGSVDSQAAVIAVQSGGPGGSGSGHVIPTLPDLGLALLAMLLAGLAMRGALKPARARREPAP